MQPRSVLFYPLPLARPITSVAHCCGSKRTRMWTSKRQTAKNGKPAHTRSCKGARARRPLLLHAAEVLFKGWPGLLKPRGRVCRRTRAAACAPDLRTPARRHRRRQPAARRRSAEQRYAAGRRESEAKLSRGNVADVCGRRGAAGAGAGAGARREHAVAHRARAYDR